MAKAYVKHDYAVTGRDYVETEGGGGGGGGVDYSTEEQDTGLKWIDGRSIYQKTIDLGSDMSINANTFENTTESNTGYALIIKVQALNSSGTVYPVIANRDSVSGYIQLGNRLSSAILVRYFTLQYVKTE